MEERKWIMCACLYVCVEWMSVWGSVSPVTLGLGDEYGRRQQRPGPCERHRRLWQNQESLAGLSLRGSCCRNTKSPILILRTCCRSTFKISDSVGRTSSQLLGKRSPKLKTMSVGLRHTEGRQQFLCKSIHTRFPICNQILRPSDMAEQKSEGLH